MGKVDLHIHSTASDGKFSPSQIVSLAKEKGLEIIALTDHDTFKGYFEARQAGKEQGITVIPGAEITSLYNGRECHVLAYDFDVEDPGFRYLVRHHKISRIKRAKWIIKQLRSKGLEIDIDEVKAEARNANVGRPHIAAVLIEKGYVAGFREAFMRYLGDQVLGNIKSEYCDYKEVLQVIRKAGGASVLAHPGLVYTEEDIQHFIKAGLDGIEYMHPSHNYELQKHYEQFTEQHQLLATGGSDFHGNSNQQLQNFGIITISKSRAESLMRMTRQRKKILTSG